jgi:polyphenol oxidase
MPIVARDALAREPMATVVAPVRECLTMTRPSPDPAFHWTAEAWGHALRCTPLAAIAQHAFTAKQLELRAADPRQSAAWAQAAASVGGGLEQLVRVKQVHGAVIHVLRKDDAGRRDLTERPAADAIASNASGLILSVQVADCVPMLIADPRVGAVAAVHAGWRGTCVGVARVAVQAMTREFGVNPSDLVAAIGPSIGPCCYTVGQNVLDQFRDAGATDDQIARWFVRDQALALNLWMANRDQLISAGLMDHNVHVAQLCTLTHRAIFESYRADGERAGRMAALIAVP